MIKNIQGCKTIQEGLNIINKGKYQENKESNFKDTKENDYKAVDLDEIKEVHTFFMNCMKNLKDDELVEFEFYFYKLKDFEQYGFKRLMFQMKKKAMMLMKNLKNLKFTLVNRELKIDIIHDDGSL